MRILPTLFLAGVLLAGCLQVPHTDPLGGGLPQIGHAAFLPATNMTKGGSARETSLALSPVDPNLLFACDPSGVPSTGNGHSYFYLSRDGGLTWSDTNVEDQAVDLRKAAFEGGDCDVAFDAAGTLYTADTWLGDLSVGSSRDGGKTWTVGTSAAGTSPVIDRPWLVGGPAGTVYLTYQDVQFGMPSLVWFAKSTDFGQTFTPAVPVTTATPRGVFTWEGNFVSVGESDFYQVYTRRDSAPVTFGPPVPESDAETVWVASSHDGGLTWSSHLVSARPHAASYLYPAIAVDGSGMLHVVFSQRDGTLQPTWYSRSTDKAATWSEPMPLLANVTSGSPWIAAGATPGQATAIFFGCPGSYDPKKGADWFMYTAQVSGNTTIHAEVATTTQQPMFRGNVSFAEFNMVRLDSSGLAHIGASIPWAKKDGTGQHWQAMYQRMAPVAATKP